MSTRAAVRRTEQVMGLPISLAVRGAAAGSKDMDDAWHEALGVLRRYDAMFSTYREDSWIARLGRAEVTPEECPVEVRTVLLGEEARLASAGAFDLWKVGTGTAGTLDPSGVVKGWAVQQAFAAFAGLRSTDVCLAAGETWSAHHGPRAPRGGGSASRTPRDPARTVAVVPVHDGAVATSGLAHRGAHLLDPRTGEPAVGWASVTVVCDDLTWADIDATAAFVLGSEAEQYLVGRGRSGVLVAVTGEARVVHP